LFTSVHLRPHLPLLMWENMERLCGPRAWSASFSSWGHPSPAHPPEPHALSLLIPAKFPAAVTGVSDARRPLPLHVKVQQPSLPLRPGKPPTSDLTTILGFSGQGSGSDLATATRPHHQPLVTLSLMHQTFHHPSHLPSGGALTHSLSHPEPGPPSSLVEFGGRTESYLTAHAPPCPPPLPH
jgi:hypothetical protein